LNTTAPGDETRTEHLSASPPIFPSATLDRLTRAHPATPAAVFLPAVAVLATLSERGMSALPALGLALAGYLLWTWQRVYLGTNQATSAFPDLSPREAAVLVPFAVLAIVLGIFPQPVLFSWIDPSVTGWVANMSVLK
jgi:NADH:ubiquinone oxidoreductase subunit 4 (subunit M)